jgi:hypothetical protein
MTRRRPEQDVQKTVAEHLRLRRAPSVYWFHPANGGARTAIEGAFLKACGVRAGTPDLICIRDGKTYGLEIKADGGRLSESQRIAPDEMRAARAEVAVAVGIDQAPERLEGWGLLRGRVT